jgi:amino acid permease
MTASLLAGHLLNLLAPAALMALLLPALSRLFPGFFGSKQSFLRVWRAQAAINFFIGALVLAAGLVLLGHDGKMLTYVALVLAMAASQWWQMGGWRR